MKELHFQDGLAPHSFEIVTAAHALALEDETIIRENLPWNGHPLGYSTAIFSPEGEYVLAGRGPDYYNAFRARAMISVLIPLLTCKKAAQIEASIILDAEPWKRALSLCSEHLENILGRESVSIDFSCESSSRVPGLQMADLVAGITRRAYSDDRLDDANKLISSQVR